MTVDRASIDALAQVLESSALTDLLRAIVHAIQEAVDEDREVSVGVDVESVPELFEAAFRAKPAGTPAPAGGHIHASFKIHR